MEITIQGLKWRPTTTVATNPSSLGLYWSAGQIMIRNISFCQVLRVCLNSIVSDWKCASPRFCTSYLLPGFTYAWPVLTGLLHVWTRFFPTGWESSSDLHWAFMIFRLDKESPPSFWRGFCIPRFVIDARILYVRKKNRRWFGSYVMTAKLRQQS